MGIGLLLAYFPYRRVRNWTLWNGHCKAVAQEQTRRRDGKTVYAGRTLPGGG